MGTIVYNPDNGMRFNQNAGTIYQSSEAMWGAQAKYNCGRGVVWVEQGAFLILRFHFPAPVVALNAPLPPLRRFTINSQQDAV